MRPRPNFSGVEGFRLRLPSQIQIQANTGAKTTMKMELTDWNQLDGIENQEYSSCV